jgi:hypothetical protein
LKLTREDARDEDRDGGGYRAVVQHGLIDVEAEVAAEVIDALGEDLLADQREAAATASDIFTCRIHLGPPALFEQDVGDRRFEECLRGCGAVAGGGHGVESGRAGEQGRNRSREFSGNPRNSLRTLL